MPTLAGFIQFIRDFMGLDSTIVADNNPVVLLSFNYALETVTKLLTSSAISYQQAVYNLAGDMLINFGKDVPPSTVFVDIRAAYKINSFVPGIVSSTSDNSTSTSLATPDFFNNLTLSDLQLMKTPYGRTYLAIAQKAGDLWGLS